jgi:rhodanese-related sulfurtransferase
LYIVKWKQKQKATEKLNELGFKNIYELDGGFMKCDEGLNNAKKYLKYTGQSATN